MYIVFWLQMLELTDDSVSHLSYERGEEVIVMKGYKFAKAKLAAAAALGCLAAALDPERDMEVLKQVSLKDLHYSHQISSPITSYIDCLFGSTQSLTGLDQF